MSDMIIAAIVFMCIAIGWIVVRQSRLEKGDNIEMRALREQVRTLFERVAVLERITTDPSAETALEIEKLRSVPSATNEDHRD